jgi:hypothetical protein
MINLFSIKERWTTSREPVTIMSPTAWKTKQQRESPQQDMEQDQGRELCAKLSDDELVEQFAGRSSGEKLAIFKRILRQSRESSDDLIKAWIHDTEGDLDRGPLQPRKAEQILDLIWQDENGLRPLFEETESFKKRVVTSTVKIIRSELEALNKKVKAFGAFDPTANPEDLDLQDVLENIKEHAPSTFQLLHCAAENQRHKDGGHDNHGRIVTIVSMLSLGRDQTAANSFARTLGLYLYTAGVPHQVLTLLNSLGITDNYRSVGLAVAAIKQNSQGGSSSENKPSKISLTNGKGSYGPVKGQSPFVCRLWPFSILSTCWSAEAWGVRQAATIYHRQPLPRRGHS